MGNGCSRHWLSTSDTNHSGLELRGTVAICSSVSSSEEMLIIWGKSNRIMQSTFLYCWLLGAFTVHVTRGWCRGNRGRQVSCFSLTMELLSWGTRINIVRSTGLHEKLHATLIWSTSSSFWMRQLRSVTKFIEPVHGRTKSKVQGA